MHFVNLYDNFYDKKNKEPRERMFMPDHIHPSAKGYTTMVNSITPFLEGHFGNRGAVLSGVLGAEVNKHINIYIYIYKYICMYACMYESMYESMYI